MTATITIANINNWKSRYCNTAAILRGGYNRSAPVPSYYLALEPQIKFMEWLIGVPREYSNVR